MTPRQRDIAPSARPGWFHWARISTAVVTVTLAVGCGPVPRLASLQYTVVISGQGDARLESHLQPGVTPAAPLAVSVGIRNTTPSPVDIEKVTATLSNADGGLLAEQSVAARLTVSAQATESRKVEFPGPWPDDAVIVVWTYVRGVDGMVNRVGSCTPLCFSCDIERTQRACEIETRVWTE